MNYQSFEELDVWKRACRLCVDLYKKLENCNDYSFRDQMRRAAVSIASNIAEGAERDSKKNISISFILQKDQQEHLELNYI